MKVLKRDGRKVEFDSDRIKNALAKCFTEVDGSVTEQDKKLTLDIIKNISSQITDDISVEEIQDKVEMELMSSERKDAAKAYITYRNERTNARGNTIDKIVDGIVSVSDDYWCHENSNKDEKLVTTQRDYIAGAVSTDLTRRKLLPDDIVEAHDNGIIHVHDLDYFYMNIHNCDLINLEDMLQNGTVISETYIDKPHSFRTACNIATQIIAQVASSQYGGQTITLAHLAPFVEISRQKFRKEVKAELESLGFNPSEAQINSIAEKRTLKEIHDGVQVIQYQVITLMTTNGQSPFITVFMYLDEVPEGQIRNDLATIIEEMLKQRILGVKNDKGVYITPAFPKLIYVLDEDNIHEDSKYYYLTKLAAKCTAKRMVPDYISAKIMQEYKNGDIYTCMGCRSFLTPDTFTDAGIGNISKAKNYSANKHKYYGRFNQGVVTINLVDVACSSNKDFDTFWNLFEERLELCHKALKCRHNRLLGTYSDVAPILWQHGALARLEKGEKIDPLLYHGYSTISLGYAGLYECVKYMTGKSHTDASVKDFALAIMQKMNDKCAEWRKAEDIAYSVYGTPLESCTYKFAKCLKKRFGNIPNVTDHDYITNSYHVNVREKIDAFTKLAFESEFQKLSPGGAISYVEVPNMTNNIDAVLSLLKFIYENIMYAELNTKSDYCKKCGYNGEIVIEGKEGHLYWKCPNCGNTDQNTMNVSRRTCGYIGTHYWNQGRTQEIKDRVMHLTTSVL